jgi:NADH:ubiquinone oxidoreductase subunit F (NADH-binding)
MSYLAAESAGQCGPCVNGLASLSDAMYRIAVSEAEPEDLERVRRWTGMIRGRGVCHHPDGAIGQLTSALSAFKDHLGSHRAGQRCYGLNVPGFPRPPASRSDWR